MGLSDHPFSVLTILVASAIRTNRNVDSHQRHGHALRARRSVSPAAGVSGGAHRRSPAVGGARAACGRRSRAAAVRALTAFYVALGGFALTTFLTMAGAVLLGGGLAASRVTMAAAIAAGGLGGLIVGASLLVSEVWLAHGVLREEAARLGGGR
jgi:hypothetical protein